MNDQQAKAYLGDQMVLFWDCLAPPAGRLSWFDLSDCPMGRQCCGYRRMTEYTKLHTEWVIAGITGGAMADGWWLPPHLSCFRRNELTDAVKQAAGGAQ